MPPNWNEQKNQWEGSDASDPSAIVYNVYADLPDPTTVSVGERAIVKRDPIDVLNGLHLALGDGSMAQYWQKA